jgi:hypothetical protein
VIKLLSKEYRKACTEVLDILEHTRKEDVAKIPSNFIEFLKKNSDKLYKPNLDHTKRIRDMGLRKETLGILAIISRKFWSIAE